MAVNLGQIIVAVISVLTTFGTCLIFIMVMKSDVRSVQENLAYLRAEIAAVKNAMEGQTEILLRQTRNETEIDHLKGQIERLAEDISRNRIMTYVGQEVPHNSKRRTDT